MNNKIIIMKKLHILTTVAFAIVIMGTLQKKKTHLKSLCPRVDKIYGNDSDATEIFKKDKWKDFKGKKVRWSGKVGEIETTFVALSISIIMNYSNTFSFGGMSYSSGKLLVSSPVVLVILKKREKV